MLQRFSRLSLVVASSVVLACGAGEEAVGGTGTYDADSAVGLLDGGARPDSGFPIFDGQVTRNDGSVVVTTPGEDGGCGAIRAEAEKIAPPVDVIWALDGSGSMIDDAFNVATNLGKFVEGVQASGANVRVVMLTPADPLTLTGSPLSGQTDKYKWVFAGVDSWNSFQQLIDQYPNYGSFLRPEAPKHIIVISDDEGFMSETDFKPQMESLLGGPFTFHAIVNPPPPESGCLLAAGAGQTYWRLAAATGGEQIPLCSDWAQVVQRLQDNVVASAPLPCDYDVPEAPAGALFDPDQVNVLYTPLNAAESPIPQAAGEAACGDSVAWHYDDPANPARVILCPAACETVRQGGVMSIAFGCETIVLN